MAMEVDPPARTLAEVDRVVKLAKLDPTDLLPESQAIKFSTVLLDQTKTLLLEVDKDQAETLERGSKLTFKGRSEDSVVLCTEEGKTYDVKQAETSNSLVILESPSLPSDDKVKSGDRRVEERRVLGVYSTYLELKPCRPRLRRLREVLSEVSITSKHDLDDSAKGRSQDYLLDNVQASKDELLTALDDLGACEFDERYFWLDEAYRMKLISDILNFADENSWSLTKGEINKQETADTLQDLEPRTLIEQVLDQYFDEDGKIKGRRLVRFFGEYLLHAGSLFQLEEFMSTWKQALPEGLDDPTEDDLAGLAIVDRTKRPHTVKYFPEHCLPENVLERFQRLFGTKERWTLEEITPFVEPLATQKLDVKALLTKFSRASNDNGVKYFSSKHGK